MRIALFSLTGCTAALWTAGIAAIPVLGVWAIPIIGTGNCVAVTTVIVTAFAAVGVRDRRSQIALRTLSSSITPPPAVQQATKPLPLYRVV
jgi:hypothetical protein